MEILFHSHFISNRVIATKVCTWHDSCAVVACANFCCDLMASNGITARRRFDRIWIAGQKPLVKQAPGLCFPPRRLSTLPAQYWEMIKNANTFVSWKKLSTTRVKDADSVDLPESVYIRSCQTHTESGDYSLDGPWSDLRDLCKHTQGPSSI